MGRKPTLPTSLAEALFSRVQLRVLTLLFGQPDRAYHASEIIRLAASGSGAVQRELTRLAQAGLVDVTASANRKLYRANRASPLFEDLHGLIIKTSGLVEPLHAALLPLAKNIEAAFVYGSVAKGSDTAGSDIDLMIIADDLAYGAIFKALQKAEDKLQRPVNPSLMTLREWRHKSADASAFAGKIARQPRLFILGEADEPTGAR
jgi:predicted nucleotidyltransferase